MRLNSKILLAVVLAGVLSLGAVLTVLLSIFLNVPDFTGLTRAVEVPIKLSDGSKSIRLFGPKAPGWAPLGEISNNLIAAVIASEDTSFYSHKGVDYFEIREAIKKDLHEKRWARGASTITQQVIKNAYLSPEKTLWRKVKEIVWAQKLDEKLTKQQILCFYLNMAEWGPGIYGIQQAARHYFVEEPSAVTPKQSAFLAMLIPSPVRYHSYFAKKKLTPWASKRVNHILKIMHAMGYIADSEYETALAESLWGEAPDQNVGAGTDEDVPRLEEEGDEEGTDGVGGADRGSEASPSPTTE